MNGKVNDPNGNPVAGATVTATTECGDPKSHLDVSFSHQAKTSEDGSFSMKAFDAGCNRIRFTASKREDFWLETGQDPLYEAPNGTNPLVELSLSDPAPFATIQLGRKGGEVEIRVWDAASDSFIKAGVEIHRRPTKDKDFSYLYIATGDDGSSYTAFLPAAVYEVRLHDFYCKDKSYFPKDSPAQSLEVVAGEHRQIELRVDITQVETRSSYDNIRAEKCKL